jgi:hypothetical protein
MLSLFAGNAGIIDLTNLSSLMERIIAEIEKYTGNNDSGVPNNFRSPFFDPIGVMEFVNATS